MSTDNFEDRLNAAGERWRAGNTSAAQVDFERVATADRTVDVPVMPAADTPPQRRRRMRVMLACAAGIAAAVAATVVAIQLGGSAPTHRPQPLTGTNGVQVVCAALHRPTKGQLLADGAVIAKRLQRLGAADGTVRVQGSDSLVITVPGGSAESAHSLCAQASLDLRPVVMPAANVSPGAAPRNSNPFDALTFTIPANETDFDRLSAADQQQLKAALGQLDCSWAAGEPRSAGSYSLACDKGDNATAKLAYLLGPAIVPSTAIVSATAQAPDVSAGRTQWTVAVTFTPGAQAAWARYTGAHNAGGSQIPGVVTQCGTAGTPCADYVSLTLDGAALSVPLSHAVIPAGTPTYLSGNFTEATAKELAVRLAGGSLPVPLRVVSTSVLPGPSPLIGTDWRLVKIASSQGAPLVVSAPLMIDKNATMTASDGCNHLGGKVSIQGRTIKVGNVVSTEMACPNSKAGFADQVARLDAVLTGTVHWSIQGEELTLSKDGKAALVYRAAPAPTTDPNALVDIDWKLTGLATDGPNGVASTPAAPATLRFDGKGQLAGSDGCNSMAGHARITPGHLDGLAFGGTLAECPGAVHVQYLLVGDVLRGSSSWSIKDGQLTVTKAGVGTLSYQPAGATTPAAAPS